MKKLLIFTLVLLINATSVVVGQSIISYNGQSVVSNGQVIYFNQDPIVINPISNRALLEHFGEDTLDISDVFIDPDGDPLTLSAISGNTSVVDVDVRNDTLFTTEVGLGLSYVTVTANDGLSTVNDTYEQYVNNVNDPPYVLNPIPDQNLSTGFSSTDIDLEPGAPNNVFADPDGDGLSYSAVSSNEGVVTVSIVTSTILRITEVGDGVSTITVTADDGQITVDDVFTTTVN